MFERSRSNRYWSLRVQAEGKLGDIPALETSLAGWCGAHPKRTAQARVHVARALLSHSAVDRALELLDLALTENPDFPLAHILSAEGLMLRGDYQSARRSFELAAPRTDSESRRYVKLKDRLGELVGV